MLVDASHIPSGFTKVTDASLSKSIISSIISQISAFSVSGSMTESAMRASLAVQTAAMTHNAALDPFTFVSGTVGTRSLPPDTLIPVTKATKASSTTPLPPPPGTGYSTLPPSAAPTAEVPAGVPVYNWRMCQYDLILMNQTNKSLEFDAPNPSSQSHQPISVLMKLTSDRHKSRSHSLNLHGPVKLHGWKPSSWSTSCSNGRKQSSVEQHKPGRHEHNTYGFWCTTYQLDHASPSPSLVATSSFITTPGLEIWGVEKIRHEEMDGLDGQGTVEGIEKPDLLSICARGANVFSIPTIQVFQALSL